MASMKEKVSQLSCSLPDVSDMSLFCLDPLLQLCCTSESVYYPFISCVDASCRPRSAIHSALIQTLCTTIFRPDDLAFILPDELAVQWYILSTVLDLHLRQTDYLIEIPVSSPTFTSTQSVSIQGLFTLGISIYVTF